MFFDGQGATAPRPNVIRPEPTCERLLGASIPCQRHAPAGFGKGAFACSSISCAAEVRGEVRGESVWRHDLPIMFNPIITIARCPLRVTTAPAGEGTQQVYGTNRSCLAERGKRAAPGLRRQVPPADRLTVAVRPRPHASGWRVGCARLEPIGPRLTERIQQSPNEEQVQLAGVR